MYTTNVTDRYSDVFCCARVFSFKTYSSYVYQLICQFQPQMYNISVVNTLPYAHLYNKCGTHAEGNEFHLPQPLKSIMVVASFLFSIHIVVFAKINVSIQIYYLAYRISCYFSILHDQLRSHDTVWSCDISEVNVMKIRKVWVDWSVALGKNGDYKPVAI